MMSPAERLACFEAALRAQLAPTELQIDDESHLHAGHTSAGSAGHYRVYIASPKLEGLSRVAQHRLVYDALAPWIPQEIHALAIVVI
ncbi:BolA family transcriptional regulator [Polynucleobacter sp. MWH-Loch1C5]|nr:BolA family protein [Polynucleobacter sp. MWH-Loch1C5]MBU3541664.1 BolA family transcriptional regulator [Polynucleobacter sp. MWH-Loch1C5]